MLWWSWAAADLASARHLLGAPVPFPRQACFLAQQAGEKSIKSVLIAHGIAFPKTHALIALRDLVPPASAVRACAADLGSLTDWAIQSRYPGPDSEAQRSDSEQAIADARLLLDAAAEDLRKLGITLPS